MSRPWDMPEREATPEAAVLSRRKWLKRIGLVAGAAVGGAGGVAWWLKQAPDEDVLSAGQVLNQGPLYPAKRNEKYAELDRTLTDEAAAARYCNFYEFSSGKSVWQVIGPFQPSPWKLEVSGLVAKPRTFDMDDLQRTFNLEERLYRHRCVEAWAMAVPWTGFPLAELLRRAEPLPGAQFVRFVSFNKPEEAPRLRNVTYPWPYNEGLTLAEATNELTLLATGMYGHPLLKQHGAPIRLVAPWKYGFKCGKSLVKIELTDKQPATFWNTLSPHEYDFQANVNPDVPHPRWSQKSERMLGTGEVRPTQHFNGYGEWVGGLYS
jgi:sulfoxide reductase catalytic subunit YedY